jgi:hypothetical protein
MAGYSNTLLIKKLGIKTGHKVIVLNAPKHYWELIDELPPFVENFNSLDQGVFDFIHFFSKSEKELMEQMDTLKSKLKKDGMLWISWPKKASKVPTDLNDMVVRNLGLTTGLVDVKVCAFDEIWSGLKFVFRKEDR